MLLSLIKVYLKSVLVSMFARQGKRKKLNPALKILIALAAIYVAAAMLLSFGMVFMQAAQIFIPTGEDTLYFIFTGIVCLIFGIFGSVFMTSSLLFEAKDNELLLSMPIPHSYILASRFSVIVIINYLYSLLLLTPACAVYLTYTGFDTVKLFYCIAGSLLLPLLSVVFCCIFGWVIAMLGAGKKKRHIFELALSLLFLFGYLCVFTNIQGVLSAVSRNSAGFEFAAKKILVPLHFYSLAMVENEISHLLIFAILTLALCALAYLLLSKTFLRLTSRRAAFKKVKYERRELKVSSAFSALVRKELYKFIQTPPYLLNCGLGIFLSLLLAVALFFKGADIIAKLGFDANGTLVPVIVCTVLLFCVLTTNSTAVSLSLEGNRLYLLKSMPVCAKDIINSKIAANVIISAPSFLVSFTLATARLNIGIGEKIFAVTLGMCAVMFVSCLGMLLNLRFPRLEWLNETVVIKQSTSVMIATFVSMGTVMIFAGVYSGFLQNVIPLWAYLAAFSAIFAAASAVIYRICTVKGEKILLNL